MLTAKEAKELSDNIHRARSRYSHEFVNVLISSAVEPSIRVAAEKYACYKVDIYRLAEHVNTDENGDYIDINSLFPCKYSRRTIGFRDDANAVVYVKDLVEQLTELGFRVAVIPKTKEGNELVPSGVKYFEISW